MQTKIKVYISLVTIAMVVILAGCDTPNNLICTDDARQCGDGSIVGRVGPHCEFEVCPGGIPAPASAMSPISTLDEDNPVELPDNVITEKNCVASGGEVWNTLGETSYKGKLIGRIEGLKCPCVCLVK